MKGETQKAKEQLADEKEQLDKKVKKLESQVKQGGDIYDIDNF